MPKRSSIEEILKKPLITVPDLVTLLGNAVSAKTIYNKISAGTMDIDHTRFGKRILFERADVEEYLESNKVAAAR